MTRIQVGGIGLNVIERGSGTPFLLAHGFPLDHSMWAGQLAGLSDACRVIAPDLRGFGASEVVPGVATMQQMSDDLAGLLDALAIREPVVFCGLSMGGYVAWQFVLRHRARLSKLILCDTRAIADTTQAAAGRLKTAEQVLKEGPGVVADAMLPKLFAPNTAKGQPQLVDATRQVILQTQPAGIAAALHGLAQRPDVTEHLPKIDVPTLVICGEHDAISPPAEMEQFAARMPKARFVKIPGAGHMAPLEAPAAVNVAIKDFLVI